MKTKTAYLTFNTKKQKEFARITTDVEKVARESGVKDGMALVTAMHITAGVYVNDNEGGLMMDRKTLLAKW